MKNTFMEAVYDTLNGDLDYEQQVSGVENLYIPGKKCDILYQQIYDAERRLEARLGISGYDDDVELIIRNMTDIQYEMCMHMYYYGARFGMRE